MLDLLIPTLAQGLLWGVMALGLYITFRVLDIADLSVEGTFPLGAAVAATALDAGLSIPVAFVLATVAGALAGMVTGVLVTRFKIPALLAGILTMIGLYSVNLHIMGKANLSLLRIDTVFTVVEDLGESLGIDDAIATLIVGLIAVMIIGTLMYWFFGTQLGTAIRATGNNPQMSRAQGINTSAMVVIGLCISNALVAISGAMVAQSNGFADVGMGVGTIVIGLASIIIGEVLFGTRSFKRCLMAVILGSIMYRVVIAVVLQLGMPPNDLKLFTAALVTLCLAAPLMRDKFLHKRHQKTA